MKREMHAVSVTPHGDGNVCINQEDGSQYGANVIVHPDQVPVLCEWLKAAANELEQQKHAEAETY